MYNNTGHYNKQIILTYKWKDDIEASYVHFDGTLKI